MAVDMRGFPNEYYSRVVCTTKGVGDYFALELTDATFSSRRGAIKSKKPDIVYVRGHDLSFNRKALEAPETQVLSRPFPLDDTLVKIAEANGTLLEICFADLLTVRGYARSRLIQSLQRTVSLAKKRSVPVCLSSGASDELGLVTPRELVAFGSILGMSPGEAKASISTIPLAFLEGMCP